MTLLNIDLSKTIEARNIWNNIPRVLKQKKSQPKILYLAKITGIPNKLSFLKDI